MARGLLLVQNVLAAVLAVLQRNQPATKLGDERVRSKPESTLPPESSRRASWAMSGCAHP